MPFEHLELDPSDELRALAAERVCSVRFSLDLLATEHVVNDAASCTSHRWVDAVGDGSW